MNREPAASSPHGLHTAGWLMFALLTLVSGTSVTCLVLLRWWLAGVLLGIGLGLALGWTCLVMMVRETGGRPTSARFVYLLWLVVLWRVLAVGGLLFTISLLSLMVSLVPILMIVKIATSSQLAIPSHLLKELLLGCAVTVLPVLCCGFSVWRWIWPLARRWWREDLQGRSTSI